MSVEFINSALKLLEKNRKVLVFLRRANSGNNRHYFFIQNKDDFKNLIKSYLENDSLTLFKSLDILNSGIITYHFIDQTLSYIISNKSKSEIILVSDTFNEFKKNGSTEWESIENVEEAKEILLENLGNNVTLIVDPDFCNKDNTLHMYTNGKSSTHRAY